MRTLFLILALAAAHEGEESPANVGEGKAVLAVDAKKGIKLSEAAVKTLGIKTVPAPRKVPASALVHYHDEVGVYRLKEGWFKLIEIDDLKAGDRIVVAGAALLRVAELDVFGGEGGGDGH